MSTTTTFVHGPILVSQRQIPRLNKCSSTGKLDFSRKFLWKKSVSHSTRYPLIPTIMMDSVENRCAACDEGGSLEGLEQEALIDGSMNFSSGGIHATLNSLSKWLVTAFFGIFFLWRRDMEVLWITSGGALNDLLSDSLKRILKHERPIPTLRSDPGMPSSHAQTLFYTMTFCIIKMVEYFGLNGITAVISAFIVAICSYFSWLRVSQGLHTRNQVVVGAVLGVCFSIFWFWLWDAIIKKAFIAHFWVQIVVVIGAAGFLVGYLLYVIWNEVNDD